MHAGIPPRTRQTPPRNRQTPPPLPGTRQTPPPDQEDPPPPGPSRHPPVDQADPPGPSRHPPYQADTPLPRSRHQHTVYERPVRILLECILVKIHKMGAAYNEFDYCEVWLKRADSFFSEKITLLIRINVNVVTAFYERCFIN